MEEQQKYYDEAQRIKVVEVAIKELDGKNYTYLMTDDYLALAKELLQFGFNDGFVERTLIRHGSAIGHFLQIFPAKTHFFPGFSLQYRREG